MAALTSEREQEDFREHLAAREFFANRLEAHFRAHPNQWISILELMQIGGPSWRSRIACDLRVKRKLNVPWNKSNLHSAYMFVPTVEDRWPAFDAPIQETWRLT
jgi:hypothetical protein